MLYLVGLSVNIWKAPQQYPQQWKLLKELLLDTLLPHRTTSPIQGEERRLVCPVMSSEHAGCSDSMVGASRH